MTAFVISYSVVWIVLALYVIRQGMAQRQLIRAVEDLRRERQKQN